MGSPPCAIDTIRSSRPCTREEQLETILERSHVGVLVPSELEGVRYNFYRPAGQLGALAGLEAKEEVSGVLRIDAEGVHRALGICLSVGG